MIDRIAINLLPAEYRVHRKSFKIKREVAYPILVAAIFWGCIAFWSIGLQNSIRQYKNELRVLQQQIDQNRPIQNEINQLRKNKGIIQEKIHALELINVNREKWVRLMEEFSNRLPAYTWVVSLKEENSTPPVIYVEGRTYSFPEVANYMSNLKACSYMKAVDLSQIEQINSKERLFRFSLSCSINADAYLGGNTTGNVDDGGSR